MATTLTLQQTNGQQVLTWFPMFYTAVLQSSTNLAGPWTSVSGATTPYTVPPTGGQALFYRLQNY